LDPTPLTTASWTAAEVAELEEETGVLDEA
jgi:hypothetical protein